MVRRSELTVSAFPGAYRGQIAPKGEILVYGGMHTVDSSDPQIHQVHQVGAHDCIHSVVSGVVTVDRDISTPGYISGGVCLSRRVAGTICLSERIAGGVDITRRVGGRLTVKALRF